MSGPNNNSLPWTYNSTHQPQTTTNNQHTNSFCPGPYTTNFTATATTSTRSPASYPQASSVTTNGTSTSQMQPYAINQAYNVPYAAGRHDTVSGSSSGAVAQRDQYGWESEYVMKYGGEATRTTGFDGASGGRGSSQGYEAGVYVTVIPQGAQGYRPGAGQGTQGAQGYQSGSGQGWGGQQR